MKMDQNGQVPSDVAHVEGSKLTSSRGRTAPDAPDRSESRLEAPKGEGVWLEIFQKFNRGRVSKCQTLTLVARAEFCRVSASASGRQEDWKWSRLANYHQTLRHSSWKCQYPVAVGGGNGSATTVQWTLCEVAASPSPLVDEGWCWFTM